MSRNAIRGIVDQTSESFVRRVGEAIKDSERVSEGYERTNLMLDIFLYHGAANYEEFFQKELISKVKPQEYKFAIIPAILALKRLKNADEVKGINLENPKNIESAIARLVRDIVKKSEATQKDAVVQTALMVINNSFEGEIKKFVVAAIKQAVQTEGISNQLRQILDRAEKSDQDLKTLLQTASDYVALNESSLLETARSLDVDESNQESAIEALAISSQQKQYVSLTNKFLLALENKGAPNITDTIQQEIDYIKSLNSKSEAISIFSMAIARAVEIRKKKLSSVEEISNLEKLKADAIIQAIKTSYESELEAEMLTAAYQAGEIGSVAENLFKFAVRDEELAGKFSSYGDNEKKARTNLSELQRLIKARLNKDFDAEKSLDENKKKLVDKIQKFILGKGAEKTAQESDLDELREQSSELDKEIHSNVASYNEAEGKIAASRSSISSQQVSLAKAQTEFEKLSVELQRLEQASREANSALEAERETFSQLDQDLQAVRDKITEYQLIDTTLKEGELPGLIKKGMVLYARDIVGNELEAATEIQPFLEKIVEIIGDDASASIDEGKLKEIAEKIFILAQLEEDNNASSLLEAVKSRLEEDKKFIYENKIPHTLLQKLVDVVDATIHHAKLVETANDAADFSQINDEVEKRLSSSDTKVDIDLTAALLSGDKDDIVTINDFLSEIDLAGKDEFTEALLNALKEKEEVRVLALKKIAHDLFKAKLQETKDFQSVERYLQGVVDAVDSKEECLARTVILAIFNAANEEAKEAAKFLNIGDRRAGAAASSSGSSDEVSRLQGVLQDFDTTYDKECNDLSRRVIDKAKAVNLTNETASTELFGVDNLTYEVVTALTSLSDDYNKKNSIDDLAARQAELEDQATQIGDKIGDKDSGLTKAKLEAESELQRYSADSSDYKNAEKQLASIKQKIQEEQSIIDLNQTVIDQQNQRQQQSLDLEVVISNTTVYIQNLSAEIDLAQTEIQEVTGYSQNYNSLLAEANEQKTVIEDKILGVIQGSTNRKVSVTTAIASMVKLGREAGMSFGDIANILVATKEKEQTLLDKLVGREVVATGTNDEANSSLFSAEARKRLVKSPEEKAMEEAIASAMVFASLECGATHDELMEVTRKIRQINPPFSKKVAEQNVGSDAVKLMRLVLKPVAIKQVVQERISKEDNLSTVARRAAIAAVAAKDSFSIIDVLNCDLESASLSKFKQNVAEIVKSSAAQSITGGYQNAQVLIRELASNADIGIVVPEFRNAKVSSDGFVEVEAENARQLKERLLSFKRGDGSAIFNNVALAHSRRDESATSGAQPQPNMLRFRLPSLTADHPTPEQVSQAAVKFVDSVRNSTQAREVRESLVEVKRGVPARNDAARVMNGITAGVPVVPALLYAAGRVLKVLGRITASSAISSVAQAALSAADVGLREGNLFTRRAAGVANNERMESWANNARDLAKEADQDQQRTLKPGSVAGNINRAFTIPTAAIGLGLSYVTGVVGAGANKVADALSNAGERIKNWADQRKQLRGGNDVGGVLARAGGAVLRGVSRFFGAFGSLFTGIAKAAAKPAQNLSANDNDPKLTENESAAARSLRRVTSGLGKGARIINNFITKRRAEAIEGAIDDTVMFSNEHQQESDEFKRKIIEAAYAIKNPKFNAVSGQYDDKKKYLEVTTFEHSGHNYRVLIDEKHNYKITEINAPNGGIENQSHNLATSLKGDWQNSLSIALLGVTQSQKNKKGLSLNEFVINYNEKTNIIKLIRSTDEVGKKENRRVVNGYVLEVVNENEEKLRFYRNGEDPKLLELEDNKINMNLFAVVAKLHALKVAAEEERVIVGHKQSSAQSSVQSSAQLAQSSVAQEGIMAEKRVREADKSRSMRQTVAQQQPQPQVEEAVTHSSRIERLRRLNSSVTSRRPEAFAATQLTASASSSNTQRT